MTQQEIDNMILDYNNGMTLEDIIKKYHHKYQTIKKIFEEQKVHIRTKSEAGKNSEKYKVSAEIEKKIIENYNNGLGLKEAGAEFNIGYYKVRTILDKNGIHRRNVKEILQSRNVATRKYHFNENYFKVINSDSAYILGFIAADGSIALKSNRLKIGLSEKDAEILYKIKEKLEYDGPIRHAVTNQGFDIASLEIDSAIYKEDLALYNIVPQKTFSFTIPSILDKKYWIDFIRGYWDGDGTICTAGKSAIRSSLCSAQKETLKQILDFLAEEYNIPKVSIQVRQGVNPIYYIQYSNTSTKKLFKAFYYTENLLYLDRKYQKFCELCIDNKNPRDSAS